MPVRYFDDTTNVRYTTDGSVPTLSSPVAGNEMLLTAPATFTIKRFSNQAAYDRTAKGVFTMGDRLQILTSPKKMQPGGLNYAYYEGSWDTWPDLKSIKPTKTGIAGKEFNVERLPGLTYALVLDGLMEVKTDGYYLFFMNGDKGTKMYIGNKQIMDWEGTYKRRTNSFMVPLQKGFYPIRLEHLRKRKDFKLEWGYVVPANLKELDSTPVPLELLYHK